MMQEPNITSWQTYDATDVRTLTHHKILLQKTITLGTYILIIQVLCLLGSAAFMCAKDDFVKIIFSDASEHICIYSKGKIHSGN